MTIVATESRIGRTFRGKWHLDALIGVGGMAAVYAATHRNGGRAAVKVLHPGLADMREIRNRFVREGYLANRVGHAAVVRAIDDDTDEDGTPFLVMELVDGETLAARMQLEEDGALHYEELLAVADQVLPALVAGHAHGVIHQDLKPENLLVDGEGRVRLLDYGIARALDDGDETRLRIRAAGTPSFMSPEQVRGLENPGPLSDVYSLGATLFALATGRPPHVASTPMHVAVKIISERAPRVSALAPDLPAEVASFIDRALEIDPARRWESAGAMLAELSRIRERLELPFSALALACRHGVTQPQISLPDRTDSVLAIVVSSPRIIDRPSLALRQPTPRPAWLAAVAAVLVAAAALAARPHPKAPQPARAATLLAATTIAPVAPSSSVATVIGTPPPVVVPPVGSLTAAPVKKKPKDKSVAAQAVPPFTGYKDSPY